MHYEGDPEPSPARRAWHVHYADDSEPRRHRSPRARAGSNHEDLGWEHDTEAERGVAGVGAGEAEHRERELERESGNAGMSNTGHGGVSDRRGSGGAVAAAVAAVYPSSVADTVEAPGPAAPGVTAAIDVPTVTAPSRRRRSSEWDTVLAPADDGRLDKRQVSVTRLRYRPPTHEPAAPPARDAGPGAAAPPAARYPNVVAVARPRAPRQQPSGSGGAPTVRYVPAPKAVPRPATAAAPGPARPSPGHSPAATPTAGRSPHPSPTRPAPGPRAPGGIGVRRGSGMNVRPPHYPPPTLPPGVPRPPPAHAAPAASGRATRAYSAEEPPGGRPPAVHVRQRQAQWHGTGAQVWAPVPVGHAPVDPAARQRRFYSAL